MNDSSKVPNEAYTRSVVISPEGAAIRVERIELSDAARRSLTTRASSLGSSNGQGAANRKRK